MHHFAIFSFFFFFPQYESGLLASIHLTDNRHRISVVSGTLLFPHKVIIIHANLLKQWVYLSQIESTTSWSKATFNRQKCQHC